ncbi:MAG TPA: S8 family serine peptidase, partial [Chromatiaceae bacterium]|nr:S8 family serine peptidase [Chromatiaceae bacterium]
MTTENYLVLRVRGTKRDGPTDLFADSFGATRSARGGDVAEPPEAPDYRIEPEALSGRDYGDLSRDPEVRAIAPPIPIRLVRPVALDTDGPGPGPDDPVGATWGLVATGALTSPYIGRGACVAVLDTGIDAAHEAFQGLDLIQKDFTGEGDGDQDGHGTHVAGTIFGRNVGGRRIGVAPGI